MTYLTKLSIIILLFLFCSPKLIGQENDHFGEFLEKYYQGGEKEFLVNVYEKINYPLQARNRCGIGHLHVKLTLNPNKGIKEIEFLNPFGFGVEEDVIQLLKKMNKLWKGLGEIREFEFSIAYQLGERPKIKGDINVVGYSIENPTAPSGCLSSGALLDRIKKAIDKGKYKKVPKLWNELIRRGYRNEEFLSLKEKYGEEFTLQKEK